MQARVSFFKVQMPEVDALLERLSARGWEWVENRASWVMVFYKHSIHETDATAEIRELLGDYYADESPVQADTPEGRAGPEG